MPLPLELRLSCCHMQACCKQLLLAACAVADLAGVKAGQRRAQDLHKVACLPQGIVHVVVVGVRVVAVPVQYVRAHFEGVAGDVGRRVAHAVELVPQDALGPAERGFGVWKRCSAAAYGGAMPLAIFLRKSLQWLSTNSVRHCLSVKEVHLAANCQGSNWWDFNAATGSASRRNCIGPQDDHRRLAWVGWG